MPPHIPCSQTTCTGYADKPGSLCPACQKIADEQARKYEANKWRWEGFRKSMDQHRKGWKK